MYWNLAVHFSASAIRPGHPDDFDIVTASDELVREHLHVEVAPTDKRWRVTIGGLNDAH
jgi:hypothetical protein